MALHYYRAGALLAVELKREALKSLLSINLDEMTDAIVDVAIEYESREKLDYFPAITHIAVAQGITEPWNVAFTHATRGIQMMVSQIVRDRLKAAFSEVRVVSVDNNAYHIPPVKPRKRHTRSALWNHYQLNLLRVEIEVAQIHKEEVNVDYDQFARHLIYRWLADSFDKLEVVEFERKRGDS